MPMEESDQIPYFSSCLYRRHCSTEMTHFRHMAPTSKDVLCVCVQILCIKCWRDYPSQVRFKTFFTTSSVIILGYLEHSSYTKDKCRFPALIPDYVCVLLRTYACITSALIPYHIVLLFTGVRRLIVVEAGSKHVEGIVSLGDAFRFLMAR